MELPIVARDVLEARAMRIHTTLPIRRSLIAVAFALSSAATAWAQSETITANASVKTSSGMTASTAITATIRHYATDAERDALLDAIKKGGSAAGKAILAKRADAGTLQVGSRQTPVKYAYARTTDVGKLVTLVTTTPIAFIGAGRPNAKPTAGYDLGLVLLEIPTSGSGGKGEIAPATKVKVDDKGAIVTEDYSQETVHLTNVAKK